jgi:hypothetical protein
MLLKYVVPEGGPQRGVKLQILSAAIARASALFTPPDPPFIDALYFTAGWSGAEGVKVAVLLVAL